MLLFFNDADAHKDKVCGYAGGYGAARIQIPKEIEPGVQFELMQSRCQLDLKPSFGSSRELQNTRFLIS